MTDFEYDAWTEKHAWLFGCTSEEWKKAFFVWRPIFEYAGYSAAELEAASAELASQSTLPEHWPDKHLQALHRVIRSRRAVVYQGETTKADKLGTCGVCSGVGRVVVPHIQGIVEGRWEKIKVARGGASWYTMAVLCSCALGRWFAANIREDARRPMTLESYEQRNPNWKEQLKRRSYETLAEFEASGAVEEPTYRALLDKLQEMQEPSLWN